MKRLDTSSITAGVAMPLKSGIIDFLQDATKETIANIVPNLIGFTPLTDVVYVLSGLTNSDTEPTYNVSAGVVYLNGEVYNVDAFSFTTSGLNKAYPRIEITQYTTNADPVQFTDGISRNVCNIRKIKVENTTVDSGIIEYKNFVRTGILKGDTKEIVCNSTYVSANFDSTGLGRLERSGWAIMNGNNGTPNDAGLTVIGSGGTYSTLEATGGASTHSITDAELPSSVKAVAIVGAEGHGADTPTVNHITVNTLGLGNAMSLMQPYRVRLRIMKI